MTRRITAALLALILLFTSFPVFAGAEETPVYTKGQTICIHKKMENYDPNAAKTTYPVPAGYMWQLKRDENGQRVEQCTQEEHAHVRECFQSGTYVCGKLVHTHDALGACDQYMGWVWEVVRDPNYDGWDYDPEAPENYAFAVCAIDPDGVHPMVGVGFAMFRLATEEEKAAGSSDRISVLENSQSLLTNQKGYAYFDGTCKTSEPAGDATWTLVQNTTKFAPGGEYHEAYRPHTVQWQVDVTVNGDGTYTVRDIREPEEQAVAAQADNLPEQGYNKELRRLVMLHDLVRVNLYIDGRFVPQGTEKLEVTITGASGFQDTITMENGDQGWHYVYENAAPDTYSVSTSLEGYPVSYKMGYPNTELAAGEGLTLDADHSNGLFEIHFGTMSNTVRLLSQDTEGKSVNDDQIRYGVYRDTYENGELPIVEFDPEGTGQVLITSDDWMEMAMNNQDLATDEDLANLMSGGSISVTLKQSQSALYYADAREEYTLTLKKAPDGAEELFMVMLAAAQGDQEVRFGENGEQIATFLHEKADLSYMVTAKTYDDAQTPNLIPDVTYALYENGEKISVEDPSAIDFSAYAAAEKREFILKQEAVPRGYDLAEEQYKITVTMEGEKPVVAVEKDKNVLEEIAAFFTGEQIEQDEFGRWTVTFTSKKTEEVQKISNTVEIYCMDQDYKTIADEVIRYGLYRDTYENGEKPIVEFDPTGVGMIKITSEEWMEIALENQTLASAGDINNLMEGGSIDITLKQSNEPMFHENAQEEYTLTLSKAPEGSADMFSVVLSVAKGDEEIRYGEDGEQRAFFVHKRIDLSYCVSIRAQDAESGEELTGGWYALREKGQSLEAPLEVYDSECDVYKFSEYATEGAVREFTLEQIQAPSGYALSKDSYKIKVSMNNGQPKVEVTKDQSVLAKVAALFSGKGVEQDANGRWQAIFTNEKADVTITNTLEIHSVDGNRSAINDPEVRYGLYRDTYQNGEVPAVEFPSGSIVQENGVIRITSDDWINLAMANQDLASTEDLLALKNGEAIDITLKQSNAPQNYADAQEEYTLTLTRADGDSADIFKVVLSTAEGDEPVRYGENGEQQVYFVHDNTPVDIINTLEIYSVDQDRNAIADDEVRYGLYRDTYQNGEVPAVEFPSDSIVQENGVIRITSDDWMNIAMANQNLASASDLLALKNGEAIDITLKQSNAPKNYGDAAEEYTLTLSRAAAGSEDLFSVVLSTAKGSEPVRYGANGEQQVYFVHESVDVPVKITNTVEIHSVDQDRNAITDDQVRYGLYRDTYQNGEVPAVEFPTEDIVQENGVIRITSEDWMNIAMANQNLASASDLLALKNGQAIDITLKQSNSPRNYGDAAEEYTLTLSRATGDSEDLFSVVLSVAKGDEPVRYSVTGAQQVTFVHDSVDMSHVVTIKTYDDAAKTNDLSHAGAVYALYENNAKVKTLDSNEIDFSTYEAVDKEYVLKQETAPQGYQKAAEEYSISLTWENGKPVVTVKKNQSVLQRIAQLFSGDSVEQDASGRWIATFTSEKIVDTTVATAKIQLTLEDIQKIWNKNTVKDAEMDAHITEMGYAFNLYWKENDTAGWQKASKQLVLSSGTKSRTGVFAMDLPVGTAYKVAPAEEDALYTVSFTSGSKTGTGIFEGTVTKEDTTANNGIISVSATPRFEFSAGEAVESLTLYKVNARDLSKPLSGAKFTLKDEDGTVLKDYTTQKDGAITIYTNTLNDSTSFTLKETIAPEGYVLLKKSVEITMEYQYEMAEENGKIVALQNYVVSPTLSDDVVQGGDGTYYIKNVYESDLPQTGDTFNPVVWTGMLTLSAAALAVLLLSSKRRRSAQ